MTGGSSEDDARRAVPSGVPAPPSFVVFWWVALFSNTTAAAMSVAIAWTLGDESLPLMIPFLNQIAGVASGMVGTLLGARMSRSASPPVVLIRTSAIQMATCLAIALITSLCDPRREVWAAGLLAGIYAVLPLAAGMGGPAWITLVANWPNSHRSSSELLMKESAQFHLGRFAGPLLGGALIASLIWATPLTAVLNALTFGAVLVLMQGFEGVADPGGKPSARTAPGWRHIARTIVASPPLWCLAALALSLDAARFYLARLIQTAGATELAFSVTVSAAGLSATVVGLTGALAARWPDRVRAALGVTLAAVALALWSVAGSTDWLWPVGGIFAGAGTALASAALTSQLLALHPSDQVLAAASASMTRTVGGTSGGLLIVFALAIGVPGLLPGLVIAALASASMTFRVARSRRQSA